MPRGRMQQSAALLRSKSCSAYAANAIALHEKNFLQTFFSLQKLWNETGELSLIFFLKLADNHFETPMPAWLPLMGSTIYRSNFQPRSIEWHAAAEPMQHSHILAAWCDFCCAALPQCAAVCHAAQCVKVTCIRSDYADAVAKFHITALCSRGFGITCFNIIIILHLPTSHSQTFKKIFFIVKVPEKCTRYGNYVGILFFFLVLFLQNFLQNIDMF